MFENILRILVLSLVIGLVAIGCSEEIDINPEQTRLTFSAEAKAGFVTGGGWIPIGNKKGTFGFNVRCKKGSNVPRGNLIYVDHSTRMRVHSETIKSLVITGNRATFTGDCKINGIRRYTFTVAIEDNGEPGRHKDIFNISLSNGYFAGDTLGGGNIDIKGIEEEEVIISDNFDKQSVGDQPLGWELVGGATADWYISDEYSHSKPNSLRITVTSISAPGDAGVVRKQFSWPLSKDLTFKFSALVTENNRSHVIVGVKEGKAKFMILFSNHGELCYHDAQGFNVVSTYSPNTWYDFKIIYHPSTDTHDLYLNGVLKGSNISSPNHPRPAGDYFGASFDVADYLGGTMYLDDIRIYVSD